MTQNEEPKTHSVRFRHPIFHMALARPKLRTQQRHGTILMDNSIARVARAPASQTSLPSNIEFSAASKVFEQFNNYCVWIKAAWVARGCELPACEG